MPHLEGWRDALERGYAPSNTIPEMRLGDLEALKADPAAFLAQRWNPEAAGSDVVLPDGSLVKRLPWISFVIWDKGFAGLVDLRYRAGSADLPPTYLGHIGYSVVPWRRGEGLAPRAVAELADWVAAVGLPYADAAILPENRASQRVMEKAGARMVGRQEGGVAHGGQVYDLWRLEV